MIEHSQRILFVIDGAKGIYKGNKNVLYNKARSIVANDINGKIPLNIWVNVINQTFSESSSRLMNNPIIRG